MNIFKSKTIAEPTLLERVNGAVNAGGRALQLFTDAAVELEASAASLQALANEALGQAEEILDRARIEADDLIDTSDELTAQALANNVRAESIRSLVSA